ncbi:UNKNOWN [Stylonychia lemnae]|uniref:Uncharacterized protein n=1 Tax=Stylonychia lemnae TaxID=5949 RepID=A0A078AS01_STYLE|nr:UNKNOWN [Stylonychia lemnae]|eukprot:CDW84949.1 UNKNOWN [Stylonychia lemnae]
MPRRGGSSGRSSGGGFSGRSSFGGGGGMFGRSSPRHNSSGAFRSPTRSTVAPPAPSRSPFQNSTQGQQRGPGLGSALGMGLALGAGSAIGHSAMNSMFGGGMGHGSGMGMGSGSQPATDDGNSNRMGEYEAPMYDGSTMKQLDMQMTPEQLNQKQLEQQAQVDPCFSNVSNLLNCLKENPGNIGICQIQMNDMVSCQKSHQQPNID